MRRHVILLVSSLAAVSVFAFGQCADQVHFQNVACCDGTIYTETYVVGGGTAYMDSNGLCGFDSIGNPCFAGRVVSCTQAKAQLPLDPIITIQ